MKKQPATLLLAAASAVLLLASCSNGAKKYTGQWKAADPQTEEMIDDRLVVEQMGDRYAVYPEGSLQDSLMYSYDAESDLMRCNRDGRTLIIRHEKNNGHLVLSVEGDPNRRLELRKAE